MIWTGKQALTEQYIRQLLQKKTETRNLDYKEDLDWSTAANDEKLKIVKDILAMANTQDGGTVLLGVEDKTFKVIGVSEGTFKSYDQTKVNDFLHKYTDPEFSCQVHKLSIDSKYIVAIGVPEFQEIPILCEKNGFSSDNKLILQEGGLYIRTEKATSEVIPSSRQMRELLGRAIVKKGDELLRSIEHLIKGKPLGTSEKSRANYEKEVAEASVFFGENLHKEPWTYGYWKVIAFPVEYQEKRLTELTHVKDSVEKSTVSLRSWDFPHTDRRNASNFGKGRQSFTVRKGLHLESYRAYQSGLFVWRKAFWEDIKDYSSDGNKILDFVSAIRSVTEFLLFVKRFFEQFLPDGDVCIKIALHVCKNRELTLADPSKSLDSSYLSRENQIVSESNVKVVDLKADYKGIAANIIKYIFDVFNCDSVTDEVIDHWQTELIERKF